VFSSVRAVSLIYDWELVAWAGCLLYWRLLWNFGEKWGLVGSIMFCLAAGVPGETGPLGQVETL